MNRVLHCTLALFGLALFPTVGFSNRAPVPVDPNVPFKITADSRTKQNRLIIPRKFLQNAGAGKVGLLEGESGNQAKTLIAGLAISISLISLVFLVIRRKSRTAQAMALLIAVGSGGLLLGTQATADVAPPISRIPHQWKMVGKNQHNVKIEITDKGDAVELILGTYRRRTLPPDLREPPKPPSDGASPPSEKAAKPE